VKSSIGETLKKCRLEAGFSVKEISDFLISKGFKASEKTVYSWETGNSQPSPDALLVMCKYYGVNDVLETFGYKSSLDDTYEPSTLAAHFSGEEYTEDELDEIRQFAEFVKNRKK
jgi:transcriptional regulator with XRE-family HTH domain